MANPIPFYCIGSINWDRYQLGTESRAFLGGSACTVAHFFTSLASPKEFKVYLIGLVGKDDYGKRIFEELRLKPFSTELVKEWEGATGSTVILLDENSERTIKRLKSVSQNIPFYLKNTIFVKRLRNALIYVKSHRTVFELVLELTDNIFCGNISGILGGIQPENFQDWVRTVFANGGLEIIFGNEEEYAQLAYLFGNLPNKEAFLELSAEDQVEMARSFAAMFKSKIACLKRGKKGATVITETESFDSPAFPVQVVDTTAAGDAFNAAFSYKYLKQAPLQECLYYACALGSLKSGVMGAQSLKINLSQLSEYVEENLPQ